MSTDPAWPTYCPQCLAARDIEETHDEVLQERGGQRGVIVTRLSCGHELVRTDGHFYPFGGQE
jgi:hypothetical protein